MIVQSSNIHMSSEHEKKESYAISQTIMSDEVSAFSAQLKQARADYLQFMQSWQGQPQEANEGGSILVMTDEGYKFRTEGEQKENLQQQQELTRSRLLESLLAAINPDNKGYFAKYDIQLPENSRSASTELPIDSAPIQLQPITMQMNFKVTESIEEYECTHFNSCGTVKTADGQEIEFGLELTMEREFSSTRTYEMTQEVVFKDPLVINFAGNAADLTDEKYEFDIDADGDSELISYLMGDSGMLALDKNNDGVINDGSELFGALTGDGFAELAEYDEDGNNFIDEADSIFSDLGIWYKTAEGEKLQSLTDSGVGAIYLGSTDTPFDIKGEENQQNGRVIASGFYLSEAGEAGSVQQIDMVV